MTHEEKTAVTVAARLAMLDVILANRRISGDAIRAAFRGLDRGLSDGFRIIDARDAEYRRQELARDGAEMLEFVRDAQARVAEETD